MFADSCKSILMILESKSNQAAQSVDAFNEYLNHPDVINHSSEIDLEIQKRQAI